MTATMNLPPPKSAPRASGPLGRYREWESIKEALEAGDTVLVKGSYVEEVYYNGDVLPRRQDLPDGAFWKYEEFLKDVEDYTRPTPRILAISHSWLTEEHPDPEGYNLSYFAPLLRHYARKEKVGSENLAIFIDWCSMHQQPLTEDEDAAFKRALQHVELWFSHWRSQVWLLTVVPDGVSLYKERGWTHFERAVSTLSLPPESVLDLGALRPTWSCWAQVARECQARRLPPATPEQFLKELNQKTFKYEEDQELCVPKYGEIFREVMENSTELWYGGLGWSDREAERLALALPYCTSLRELDLRGNIIADAGAYALADVVSLCPQLQVLDLEGNILEEAGIQELESAWADALKNRDRLLMDNQQTTNADSSAAKKAAAFRAGAADRNLNELSPEQITSLLARQAAFEARIEIAVQKLTGGLSSVAESAGIDEEALMTELKMRQLHPHSSPTQLRL